MKNPANCFRLMIYWFSKIILIIPIKSKSIFKWKPFQEQTDLTVCTRGTHTHHRSPLKKGLVGRVCSVPPRKSSWNGTSWQIYILANVCPDTRICPKKAARSCNQDSITKGISATSALWLHVWAIPTDTLDGKHLWDDTKHLPLSWRVKFSPAMDPACWVAHALPSANLRQHRCQPDVPVSRAALNAVHHIC